MRGNDLRLELVTVRRNLEPCRAVWFRRPASLDMPSARAVRILVFVPRRPNMRLRVLVRNTRLTDPRPLDRHDPFVMRVTRVDKCRVGEIHRHPVCLDDASSDRPAAAETVMKKIIKRLGDRASFAKKLYPSRIASDVNLVFAALLIESLDESLGQIGFVTLRYRGFVIAGRHLQKAVGIGRIELDRLVDQQVQVISADVLGPELCRIRTSIPFALHRAKQITDVDDMRVSLDRFVKVLFFEFVICVSVVVMPVAR